MAVLSIQWLIFCTLLSFSGATFRDITLSECGILKGCVRPTICSDSSCAFLTSWKLISEGSTNYVEFELKGIIQKISGFIFLGFSVDRKLGNDGLVGCYYEPSTASVKVVAGYNDATGQNSNFFNGADDKLLISEGDDLGGVYDTLDNTIQCRFRRRIQPLENANRLKDLTSPNLYYLIVSRGSDRRMNGFGKPFAGGQVMTTIPVIITSPLYGSMSGVSEGGSPIAKMHGCLMVLAWVLFASVAILLARYYKEMWPNGGLLGERVWFQAHRILQGLCVGLTCLAVILAFIYCGGYSRTTAYPYYVHPILGLIVFSLALVNPFIALCRCNPVHEDRPWFNWIHFFIGTFAHVLSVPTMLLGLRMPGAGLQLQYINYPSWILIFFIIFQFCVELILEIHSCNYYRRNKNKRHAYILEVEQYQAAKLLGNTRHPRPPEPEPSGSLFKSFILGLHATIACLVTVVLIIIIIIN